MPRKSAAPSKRRAPARGKKKKNSGMGFGKLFLAFIFVGMLSASLWLLMSNRLIYTGMTEDWVRSVLIAAQIDVDQQVQVAEKNGTERWKITLHDKKRKDAVLEALASGVKARGGDWDKGEELWRNGKAYHIVELTRENGSPLRLIFEISPKPKPKAAPPKQEPARKPPPTKPKSEVPLANNEPVYDATDELPADFVSVDSDAADLGSDEFPEIAIILDDIGNHDVDVLQPVLDLKYPITFAVLPHLAHSRSNAYYLHQHQYEVMLHMPMEPEGYPRANPGEGAIFSHYNDAQIRDAIAKALRAVPFVIGVNNHMGSKITASRSLMRPVLDEIKTRDLYYIDSRTQSNTVAFKMARDMGLNTGRRDVFLDSEQSYPFAVKQLKEARALADKQGYAVVIGHPYPTSLSALADEMPKLNEAGYRFVFASKLVHRYNNVALD